MGLSPRVGRVGLPESAPPKALDVNCSERYENLVAAGKLNNVIGDKSHSWYFHDDRWYADLAATISGKIDRNAVPTRNIVAGKDNDFVLKPA